MPRSKHFQHSILYVIHHLDTSLYKIGITSNWERRKKELEVGNKTRAIHVVRIHNPRQVEKFLHRRFAQMRLPQSEWFYFSAEELDFVRSTIIKAKDDYLTSLERASDRVLADNIRNRAVRDAEDEDGRSYPQSTLPGGSTIGSKKPVATPVNYSQETPKRHEDQTSSSHSGESLVGNIVLFAFIFTMIGWGLAQIAGNIGLAPALVAKPEICSISPGSEVCKTAYPLSILGVKAGTLTGIVLAASTLIARNHLGRKQS